jgi:hypothetical protein
MTDVLTWLTEKKLFIASLVDVLHSGTPGRIVVTRCQHDLARDIDELERLDALTLEATDDSSSIGKNQSESQICSSDEDEEHKNCGLPDWHADLIKENSNQSVTDNRQPNSEPHTVQPSASQTARSDVHSTRSVMEILSKKRRGQMRTCLIDVSQAPPPADEVPLTSKVKTQTSSSHPIVSNVKPERRSIVSPGTASASSQNAQNLDNIKYVLFDWRTKETVQMLTSIEALCQDVRLCDEPSPVESLPDKVPTSDMKRSNNVQPTNGVPDDEELSAEKQQYEIKVKEFYGQKCLVNISLFVRGSR